MEAPLRLSRRATLAGAAGLLATAAAKPPRDAVDFPHSWENCVGSGHAVLGLRARWRTDLATAHAACGFRAVRFHGLLDDDLGLCRTIGPNGPELHFLMIDRLIDGLLAAGVRPFVELSFMPRALASSDNSIFWWQGNTSPPASLAAWSTLVAGLARHFLDRYGAPEILAWRFECWNEPNLTFWAADQSAYFHFYAVTARALKSVHPGLAVGGPATAQAGWIAPFLAFCAAESAPLDFVSTHLYADDPQINLFGTDRHLPPAQVMPTAIRAVRATIAASAFPALPLVLSEWSSDNPAFIAQTVRDCAPLVDTMSYWTFDNEFEEHGPETRFGNQDYGLIGPRGIPRPTFHAFTLLHRLGHRRLMLPDAPVLATLRPDGTLAILAWNLPDAQDHASLTGNPLTAPIRGGLPAGAPRRLTLPLPPASRGLLTLVDPAADPASLLYQRLGRPDSPSQAQLAALAAAARLPAPRPVQAGTDGLALTLPANAVALLEIPPAASSAPSAP